MKISHLSIATLFVFFFYSCSQQEVFSNLKSNSLMEISKTEDCLVHLKLQHGIGHKLEHRFQHLLAILGCLKVDNEKVSITQMGQSSKLLFDFSCTGSNNSSDLFTTENDIIVMNSCPIMTFNSDQYGVVFMFEAEITSGKFYEKMNVIFNRALIYVSKKEGVIGMYLSRSGNEVYDRSLKEYVIFPKGFVGDKLQEDSVSIIR